LGFSETSSSSSTIKTIKLFNVGDYEEPILYFYTEPVESMNFHASNSTFYCIENNQIKELVRGNEYGGSLRGDYVQLYFEKETEKIRLGTEGFYGGFGGNASDYRIYRNDKVVYISIAAGIDVNKADIPKIIDMPSMFAPIQFKNENYILYFGVIFCLLHMPL